jgi:hypothetical protein
VGEKDPLLSRPIRTEEYPVDDLDFSKKILRLKKIHIILFKKERKENVNCPATLSLHTSFRRTPNPLSL